MTTVVIGSLWRLELCFMRLVTLYSIKDSLVVSFLRQTLLLKL